MVPATSAVPRRRKPRNPEELELIAKAQQGDERAFEGLYIMHKRRVFSLCMRMLGNTAEAEDQTQESFLQLHRKIGTFRGDSAFSTWFHRLTVNVVLMTFRKKRFHTTSLEEIFVDDEFMAAPAREIHHHDPRLMGSIDRITLERAIAQLPPGYRLVFVLHDIEGFEHNEIAEMLDCTIGNSKSQLSKARWRLSELLGRTRRVNSRTPASAAA